MNSREEIELSEYQFTLCKLFSEESAKTQQRIEFGEISTGQRSIAEVTRDNLIGKMAEAAICSMLWSDFGLRIPVNYDVYPRGEYDDEDIRINGWSIDVKATRSGRFLLLEDHKIRFRLAEQKLPDVIAVCRVPWDRVSDVPAGRSVELVGCVSISRLLNPKTKCVSRLSSGQFIPNTLCRLQSSSYCMDFAYLTDMRRSIELMLSHKRRNTT